jgi:hypothetical protein
VDTSQAAGGSYRQFISYLPTAEYRISDFGDSRSPISSVDVKVYWKNRLNGQLYPVQMVNLSSVHFKLMFRKKGGGTKKSSAA